MKYFNLMMSSLLLYILPWSDIDWSHVGRLLVCSYDSCRSWMWDVFSLLDLLVSGLKSLSVSYLIMGNLKLEPSLPLNITDTASWSNCSNWPDNILSLMYRRFPLIVRYHIFFDATNINLIIREHFNRLLPLLIERLLNQHSQRYPQRHKHQPQQHKNCRPTQLIQLQLPR